MPSFIQQIGKKEVPTTTMFPVSHIVYYLLIFRYGILVDPQQWLIVLTGRQEGEAEHPSLYLLAC